MTVEERILNGGFMDVIYFTNPSYDSAFLGVTENNTAVYDYNLMIGYLMRTEKMTEEEAIDFISYNTIRALPYMGDKAPEILYRI